MFTDEKLDRYLVYLFVRWHAESTFVVFRNSYFRNLIFLKVSLIHLFPVCFDIPFSNVIYPYRLFKCVKVRSYVTNRSMNTDLSCQYPSG